MENEGKIIKNVILALGIRNLNWIRCQMAFFFVWIERQDLWEVCWIFEEFFEVMLKILRLC